MASEHEIIAYENSRKPPLLELRRVSNNTIHICGLAKVR